MYNGHNLIRVTGNVRRAHAVAHLGDGDGLRVGSRLRAVDIVNAADVLRYGSIDFYNHLLGAGHIGFGSANRSGRNNVTILINGAGLNQSHINRVQITAAYPLRHKAQGHIHIFYLAFVDGLSQVCVGLVRHAALQHAGTGKKAVKIVSQRGAGIHGQVQLLSLLCLHGEGLCHLFRITGKGEAGHAQRHSRLNIAGSLAGRTDLGEQRLHLDAAFKGVRHFGVGINEVGLRNTIITLVFHRGVATAFHSLEERNRDAQFFQGSSHGLGIFVGFEVLQEGNGELVPHFHHGNHRNAADGRCPAYILNLVQIAVVGKAADVTEHISSDEGVIILGVEGHTLAEI